MKRPLCVTELFLPTVREMSWMCFRNGKEDFVVMTTSCTESANELSGTLREFHDTRRIAKIYDLDPIEIQQLDTTRHDSSQLPCPPS